MLNKGAVRVENAVAKLPEKNFCNRRTQQEPIGMPVPSGKT